MDYKFGTKITWHCSGGERGKDRDIPAVILEKTKVGVIYIFTMEPIVKGYDTISNRTTTVFPQDITIIDKVL